MTPEIVVPRQDALRVALQRLGHPAGAEAIEALSQQRLFAPHTTPTPASEAAAHRLMTEAATQQFRYDLMAAPLADRIRNQIPALKADFAQWGAVQSVTFREVDPQGADVYDVRFANGGARLAIILADDGKALVANLVPA